MSHFLSLCHYITVISHSSGVAAGESALSFSVTSHASQKSATNQVLPLTVGSILCVRGKRDSESGMTRNFKGTITQVISESSREELKVLVDAGDDGLILLSAPAPFSQAQVLVPRVRAALVIASACMM